MLVGQLIISVFFAFAAAFATYFAGGNILMCLLAYSVGGSVTLVSLATLLAGLPLDIKERND